MEKVAASSEHQYFKEFTFHQPKMPPIPEDAVVIADYMLMADFVAQTAGGIGKISKGVRSNSSSRDGFYDDAGGTAFQTIAPITDFNHGLRVNGGADASSATDTIGRLPSFGTNYVIRGFDVNGRHALYVDSDSSTSTMTHGSTTGHDSFGHLATAVTLGVHKFGVNAKNAQTFSVNAFEVATPIHTSSHYQTFETPFLHELVGGDRNMEQTNLVVTPDGKTWDEVTRDVSYIGKGVVSLASSTSDNASTVPTIFDEVRGTINTNIAVYTKNWTVAYDRVICLVGGQYRIDVPILTKSGDAALIYVNGSAVIRNNVENTSYRINGYLTTSRQFKRGDYVQVYGGYWTATHYSGFRIVKL